MSYVERIVSRDPDESIVYWAFLSVWSLLPNFISGAACLLLSIVSLLKLESAGFDQIALPATFGFGTAGLVILVHAIAKFYTTEIAITNKQLITKPGIIARNGTTLLLARCESCNLKQSVVGRLFNYGSIIVSGAGDTNAVMLGISNPMMFQDTYSRCYDELQQHEKSHNTDYQRICCQLA